MHMRWGRSASTSTSANGRPGETCARAHSDRSWTKEDGQQQRGGTGRGPCLIEGEVLGAVELEVLRQRRVDEVRTYACKEWQRF